MLRPEHNATRRQRVLAVGLILLVAALIVLIPHP
jgi:hypothetical protein